MIKQILVPTDGSSYASVGVNYSVALAKQHGASLVGLHVIDVKLLEGPFLRDISASLGTAPYVNYQNNISLLLEERGKASLDAFKLQCEEGELRFEERQVIGPVAHTIIEHSELVDLLVMGRGGEHGDWLEGLLGSTTEAVVRGAKCPVLITGRENAEIQRILVAYDGSEHAREALHFATGISETWSVPFSLLVVNKGDADSIVAEAKKYLEAHELDVEYIVEEGDPRDVILQVSSREKSDLVVMGAFGHSKVRELVLGSTTHHVINHAECPVLLVR